MIGYVSSNPKISRAASGPYRKPSQISRSGFLSRQNRICLNRFRLAGNKNHDRLGLRKTAQVVKMTVRPIRDSAYRHCGSPPGGRNGGDTASGLPLHLGDEPRASLPVMLMIVVHGFLEEVLLDSEIPQARL